MPAHCHFSLGAASLNIHKQGCKYASERALDSPIGPCSQLGQNDFQYSVTENSDHDAQTMEELHDSSVISVLMAFDSLQSVFTYITTFTPRGVDSFFPCAIHRSVCYRDCWNQTCLSSNLHSSLPVVHPQTICFISPRLLWLTCDIWIHFWFGGLGVKIK